MLILAGISLSGLIGGKGLFQRTEKASNRYNEAKARETLETVLLTDGQYDKNINPKYNQNEYLNELIKKEIPGSKVIEDVAIVDDYGYELDRSVPKIGRYVGKEDDLIWPKVDATVKLADDKKDATITITASEEKQGINKIEIWLLGEKIKEYTYDPSKPEATENYIATQNGEYTIKAYGDLMASKTVEVNGIVASVKFDPNGDETWKKSHSTTVTIQETADKVINSKYYWSNSVTTPDDSKFPEDQTFKSGDTITKNGDTGTYYLWTRLQTQSGEILKWRSEGFNFDNTGPTATLTPTPVSYSSFKLNLTAQDNESGIDTYEIFVKGVSQGKTTVNGKSATKELTITNATYGDNSCYVIVTDKLGNSTRKDITAKTLMDTTGPNITSFTATKSSATAIVLSATAQDTGTGTVKFEFYVDNVLKSTQTCGATTSSVNKSVTITGLSTGSHSCKVIVYDAKNNSSTKTTSGSTKLYTWSRFNVNSTTTYTKTSSSSSTTLSTGGSHEYDLPVCSTVSTNEFLSNGYYRVCYAPGRATPRGRIIGWTGLRGAYCDKHGGCCAYVKSFKVGSSYTSGAGNKTLYVNYVTWSSTPNTTYTKGTANGEVTGNSSSAYPSNGRSGSYWYVYKGIY